MAFYRTGTVAVTQGGKTVTGTGTLWAVTVQPGDAFVVTDANGLATGGIYEIASVNSNTSLTLYQNYQGTTASGLAYAVLNMAGDQTTASFANRLSQFFDKQQALLNAPGVNVIKVGGVTFTPDAVARTLELVAGAGITLTPSAAGKTVTIAGTQATESAIGSVELATAAEAAAGTDTVRAVTPAGLLAWANVAGLRGVNTDVRAASTNWNDLPAEFAVFAGLAPKLVDLSVTTANSPFSTSVGYAYVFHFNYISTTTSCVQVAIPYSSGYGSIYYRTHYIGTWNAWRKLVDTKDPVMPILSTTSTDDATSTVAAPLKSAGGLAVAKNAQIGQGIVMAGSKSIYQTFTLSQALNAAGKGVSIPLGMFYGYVDVCLYAMNVSAAVAMKRVTIALTVNGSTGAHVQKQSAVIAALGANASQINIDLVKDATGTGTSLVVWSTGADLTHYAILDVKVSSGMASLPNLTYTAVTV